MTNVKTTGIRKRSTPQAILLHRNTMYFDKIIVIT
jgi:hypothetical protein